MGTQIFNGSEFPITSSRHHLDIDRMPTSVSGDSPDACQRAAGRAACPGDHREGVGLVSSKQRETKQRIPVDAQSARLKRLQRSTLTAARLHCCQKRKWKVAMVTCTYAPEHDWQPNQIGDLIRNIRAYLKVKAIEIRYTWVQEFTKKGRPHYHLLLWLPFGITLPKPDKRGWWPYGMTKIEWARCAIGYIAKYASKADSLHLPVKGARMHGAGGLNGDALLEARWWKLPRWARLQTDPQDRARRQSGGGILKPETGELLKTPWRVYLDRGKVWITVGDEIQYALMCLREEFDRSGAVGFREIYIDGISYHL